MMHTLRFLSKSRAKGKSSKNIPSTTASLVSLVEEHNESNIRPSTKPAVSSNLAPVAPKAPGPGSNSSLESFSDGIAQSFCTTPPRSTAQSQIETEAEKDDAAAEAGYAVVQPVDDKQHDNEWTRLDAAEDVAAKKLQQAVDAAVRAIWDEAEARIRTMEQQHEDELRELEEQGAAARRKVKLLELAQDRDKRKLDNERDAARKEIEALAAQLDEVRKDITHEREENMLEMHALDKSLSEAQDEIKTKSDVISQLHSELSDLQDELASSKTQNISLASQAGNLEDRHACEMMELETKLMGEVEQMETKILDNMETIHVLQGIISELEDQSSVQKEKSSEQKRTITDLEETMAHIEEEARTIRETNKNLRSIIARYEGKLSADKVLIDEKDARIEMLGKSSAYMTAELVQLNEALNASKRENSMLADQLRQQSNDILASKKLNRPGGGGGNSNSNSSGGGVSSSPGRIGRGFQGSGHTTRVDAALRTAHVLNEEVFQLCASLTDQLEDIAKRFVADDGARLARAENLKPLLGTELVRYLQRQAQDTTPAAASRLAIIQVALQGCLTASCTRIITSWYPNDWEYGHFLHALYQRMRGALGEAAAADWRKMSMKCCARPSDPAVINKLTVYLTQQVEGVLSVSGWSREEEKVGNMMNNFTPKLREIATLAARLSGLISTGAVGELEGQSVKPGATFDLQTMDNHDKPQGGGRRQKMRAASEEVVCTIALGLSTTSSDGESVTIHLKPQVVLYGSIL